MGIDSLERDLLTYLQLTLTHRYSPLIAGKVALLTFPNRNGFSSY